MRSCCPALRALFTAALLLAAALVFTGCESTGTPHMEGIQDSGARTSSRSGLAAAIAAEEPGDYWIARRYYKQDYKFWGYVRRPQQPWSSAVLVLLNENIKLAPDREGGRIGSDNGVEYKLYGELSNDPMYEPASNSFYPVFTLKGYEVKDLAPPNIFHTSGALDPARRIIAKPY